MATENHTHTLVPLAVPHLAPGEPADLRDDADEIERVLLCLECDMVISEPVFCLMLPE
jgi:hypothetical protein